MPRSAETLVQFEDPAALIAPAGLPGELSEEAAAGLYGLSVDGYRTTRRLFEARVDAAVNELLEDAGFADRVDALPFAAGELIVAAGDSLTADLQSWARILAALLERRRPGASPRFLNAGLSGDTTTGLLARTEPLMRAGPDWLLTLAGTNDARRHGVPEAEPLVSNAETAANLDNLAGLARTRASAELVWLTPPPMIPELVDADPDFRDDAVWWRQDDLTAKARLVRELPGRVVDLEPVFGRPPAVRWYLADGLHLSLEGQARVARAVVEVLTNSDLKP
jgi:acyl-CoA thioesterase-1